MTDTLVLEIVGYKDMECSPFPCDANRTCGLFECAPTNALLPAVEALRIELASEFGDRIEVKLTLLDNSVPEYIKEIYEREHPALPMVLIQDSLVPVGRISLEPIKAAISKHLADSH